MRTAWSRLIGFGFHLLYNELAWTYDAVSWVVSRGLWRRWQQTALAYIPPGARVLELGFGPGHVLVEMAQGGHQPVGLDISRDMLRLARRRLAKQRLDVPLCQGVAQHLPFAAGAFDAVVLTFPTPFVYDPLSLASVWRILRAPQAGGQGGCLILVLEATFDRQNLLDRILEWLYHVTGQRGYGTGLPRLLQDHGFEAWRETVFVDGTQVGLVLARKGSMPD